MKFELVNKTNILIIVSIGTVLIYLSEWPTLFSLFLVLTSLLLGSKVHKYGVKPLIFKPDLDRVQNIYALVESGNLEGLKQATKNILPSDLHSMH